MARGRRNFDWDYSTLHKTGEKVKIFRNLDRIEAVTDDTMSTEEGTMKKDLSLLIQNEDGIVDETEDFFC